MVGEGPQDSRPPGRPRGRPRGSRNRKAQRFSDVESACSSIASEEARRLVVALAVKIRTRERITGADVPGLGLTPERMPMNQTAELLGYSNTQLYNLARKGAPRNADGTWNVPELSRWLRKRRNEDGDGTNLKDLKTKAEIARLEAQVARINDSTIPRADHERLLISRAASLRNFWDQAASMNAYRFVGLTLDEARVRLDGLTREGMAAYVGSRVEELPVALPAPGAAETVPAADSTAG